MHFEITEKKGLTLSQKALNRKKLESIECVLFSVSGNLATKIEKDYRIICFGFSGVLLLSMCEQKFKSGVGQFSDVSGFSDNRKIFQHKHQ